MAGGHKGSQSTYVHVSRDGDTNVPALQVPGVEITAVETTLDRDGEYVCMVRSCLPVILHLNCNYSASTGIRWLGQVEEGVNVIDPEFCSAEASICSHVFVNVVGGSVAVRARDICLPLAPVTRKP